MKRFILLIVILLNLSCAGYLDIVPDNTVVLEDYFSRKEMAWNTLAKVYSYLPNDPATHSSTWLLGDEWVGQAAESGNREKTVGNKVMQGWQNESDPILGFWSGTGLGKPLYQGIRNADLFLQYINIVEDMSEEEINEWKAQVKFLKAYYTFILLRHYGPIVLVTKTLGLDAEAEELFQRRSKVEDCFDYIINLIDEALPDLKIETNESDMGQINRLIALSIKARILLFRASPFYNGNRGYYEDFLDHNGEPFFPLEYKHEKWKDALDAVEEAIRFGEANGYGLYRYQGYPYNYDREDYAIKPDTMQRLYDLRMLIVDPWNRELIWGQNPPMTATDLISCHSAIFLPETHVTGISLTTSMSEQWLAASYAMLTRYYTKNGIPIGDDMTFNKNAMFDVVTTPGVENPEYENMRGLLQPGTETLQMYMDREMRFYANMGITGGYWRGHGERIGTQFYSNSDGGYVPALPNNYLCTGIGVQKFVHPESKSGRWERTTKFPYPVIRMADLYLMKAEILNEYLDAPSQEVYDAINKVRERAGIPKVEDAWSNDRTVTPRSLNKHLSKDGMRDIILQERSIELAFEGSHFWDMYRHKRAMAEFSTPAMGWYFYGPMAQDFFVLSPWQYRRFLFKDYLYPISLKEMNVNGNLIQNPGW
ncbi:MAG: RagB/SusD family nutrient uptake outer membrane protein [Prevotellaceae bacterium]|jgi:hypothetical protein|nr:RagB/SusD family nutrient uptake outer membrane protein [Prevotellaceae bacterium]